MLTVFESDRQFQLWRAVVGHSQLLLRSTKTEEHPTRIDVLFKPVQGMKLRTLLDGLRIREADPHEANDIARETGEECGDEFKCFVIESRGFRGFVVATVMTTAEDAGEYSDPSQLLVG